MIRFESVPIGKIGDVITGRTPKTEVQENFGNDYMFVGPTDLHKHFFITNSEKMISEKGLRSIKGSMLNGVSILVGCIGWDMGNVGVLDGKCATNQQINSITNIDKKYNPLYIYYWLKNKKDFLFQQASVTRTPILNKTSFSEIRINVPLERNEQDKIVDLLIAMDKKIELNNRINTELEAMAKTLYDYWFVQFDFSDTNGKPYKTSGGKMVYNTALKREIPEGWVVDKINNIVSVKDGTHDSPKAAETGYPLITSKHLLSNGIDFDSANLISEAEFIAINKRSKVDTGDILFSMIGTVGTVYKIEEKDINFAIKNVALYKTSEKIELKNYIYMYLTSWDMQRYMSNVLSGSIQKFIGLGALREMPLMIPVTTIKKFESKTSSIFQEINNRKVQNKSLVELRDWLLPMLMNGQVKVMPSQCKPSF